MQRITSNISTLFATATLALVLFVGLPGAAQAQAPSYQAGQSLSWIDVGIKGGVSMATFSGDDVGDIERRTGFTGGLFVTYNINPLFAIQPELLFTMKGAKVDVLDLGIAEDLLGNVGEVTYDFGYLEIPLLLKANLPLQGGIRPTLFVGPVLDIKLYGDVKSEDLDESVELDDRLKSTDWGVTAGAGLNIGRFGGSTISLDGRYTWGMSNTFDVAGDPDVKNGAFTFTLGFGL